jgi:hypothetical protein
VTARVPESVSPARTVALVVTVDRYDDPGIQDLPGLVDGADRFVRWLVERGVAPDDIVRLGGDRPATSSAVEEALTEELPARDGDLLWIYWAGHGLLLPGDSRRLLLANARPNNRRNIDLNSVLELYRTGFLSGFDTQIGIIDACQFDVHSDRAVHLPTPLALPTPDGPVRSRAQRMWLACGHGERAAYRDGEGLFSTAALGDLTATTDLLWLPDYQRVRTAFQTVLDARALTDTVVQNPVLVAFVDETGAAHSEAVSARSGDVDPLTAHPALGPYLRWLAATHAFTGARIASTWVRAPLAEIPSLGEVVSDGSNTYARTSEIDYLRSQVDGEADDEPRRIAARPLATQLTAAGHVDAFTLAGRPASPAAEVLDHHWRSVVLGHPGSGKTTLVRELVRRRTEPDAVAGPRWRLPVLCRAADLVAALTGSPARGTHRLPVTAITAGWSGAVPADPLSGERIPPDDLTALVRLACADGRLLLVIDGLDEVPTRQERERLVGDLNAWVEAGGARFGLPDGGSGDQLLVTSRLVGYYAGPLLEPVRQLMLRPMPLADVRTAGAFWLRAHARATGRVAHSVELTTSQFTEIVEADHNAAHRVFDNPFLLVSVLSAVITGALSRRTAGARPVNRSDLYTYLVDDAVANARAKRPHLALVPVLDLQTATAHAMHRTSRTGTFDLPGLRDCVADAVRQVGGDVDPALQHVLELGLLTARGQDVYAFQHQTLEEYLAGRWLVGAPDAADRIARHIDDARWVEALRLGLGHLAGTAPDRFDLLLTGLLTGPARHSAATLVATSLPELPAVHPHHVSAAVTALLEADSVHAAATTDDAPTVSLVHTLVTSQVPLVGGAPVLDPVTAAIVAALSAKDDPWLVATAARVVEALGLFSREIAECLCRAQYHDSPEYGWRTVRALHAIVNEATAPNTDPDRARAVWEQTSEEDKAALAGASIVLPSLASAAAIRSPLPADQLPMRDALDDEVLSLLLRDTAMVRVVYCLYGAIGFHDVRRWRDERARLLASLRTAADPRVRENAAVRLDTVVAMALKRGQDDAGLRADQITVDSPLTPRLLGWLRADASAAHLARCLLDVANDTDEPPAVRGDAFAALYMLHPTGIPTLADNLRTPDGTELRATYDRLVWRLQRTMFVFGDAVATVRPASLLDEFTDQGLPEELLPSFSRTLTRALALATGENVTGPGVATSSRLITDVLAALVCGAGADQTYRIAVALDTAGRQLAAGGPHELAVALTDVPQAVVNYPGYAEQWAVHPASPRGGNRLADALTVVDGLAAHLTFLRCWLVDRLSPALVEAGFGAEAVCVVLPRRSDDPVSVDRTVARLVAMMPEVGAALTERERPATDPLLVEALAAVAGSAPSGYPRARAHLRIARLRGLRVAADELRQLADGLDPLDGVRLVELACALQVTTWSEPVLAQAVDLLPRLDAEEHSRARQRLSSAVRGVPAATVGQRGRGSRRGRAATEPAQGAASPVSVALIAYQGERTAPEGLPVVWPVLCTALIAAEALMGMRLAHDHHAADWHDLRSPATRAATVALLRRTSVRSGHELTPARRDILMDLVEQGDVVTAESVLAHCRLGQRSSVVDDLRTAEHRRVRDLAALLVVETGVLDEDAVAALPRLLADPDDLVRLRTSVATAQPARGGNGRPPFTTTSLGPRPLALLVRAVRHAEQTAGHVFSDLWWALTDLRHDSWPVLRETLDLLTGTRERECFLRSLRMVEGRVLVRLPELLPSLAPVHQLALLDSLDAVAENPGHKGVPAHVLARITAPLRSFMDRATDPVAALVLEVLGDACEPTAENVSRLRDHAVVALDPMSPDTVPIGAITGLSRVIARARRYGTTTEQELARSITVLRATAASPNPRIATAGVAGLLRAGQDPDVDGLLWRGDVDAVTVLHGRMQALQTWQVRDYYHGGLVVCASFVHEPAHLSGRDAEQHSRRLVAALVARADELLDEPEHPHGRRGAELPTTLGVLAAMARLQVAPVREAVDRFPGLREKIVASVGSAPFWLQREHALGLLILLGRCDRDLVRAVLDSYNDTDWVRQRLIEKLEWFDEVEPDGLAELLAATEDDRLSRCHLAVRVLISLLRHRCLDDAEHAEALRAVQSTLTRPDAHELLFFEVGGLVAVDGSFAENVRRLVGELLEGAATLPTGAGRRRFVLRVTGEDQDDHPVDLVLPSDGVPSSDLILAQAEHHVDHLDRPLARALTRALDHLADAANSAGVSLEATIAARDTGPPERSQA